MDTKKTLYLVDINSLIFRAYYGIKQELTAKDGSPVKVLYGLIKMLNNIVKNKRPTEMVIAYDSQTKLKRVAEYENYDFKKTSTYINGTASIKEWIDNLSTEDFYRGFEEIDEIIKRKKYSNNEFRNIYDNKNIFQKVSEFLAFKVKDPKVCTIKLFIYMKENIIKENIKNKEKIYEKICLFYESCFSYKATRPTPPNDLKVQFPMVKEFIKKTGFQSFEVDGDEADDIIATLAVKYKSDFDEIYIVSGDKDLMQLVDDNTFVYDTMKNVIYDIDAVYEKFGVYPEQIGDYLAIIGDKSDNIPGVDGIGPKGAEALLKQFKTLDSIYINIALIKGKKKEHFINNEKNAYLSRKLVALNYDLPIEIINYKNGGLDLYTNDLLNFYDSYDLSSIIGNRKFTKITNGTSTGSASVIGNEGIDFSKFKKITDITEIEDVLILLKNEDTSFYFNFNNKEYKTMEIFSFSVAYGENVFYFLYTEENKEKLNYFLSEIFNSDALKTVYNSKLLVHLFKKLDIKYKNIYDIMLASYMVDATAHNHTIEDIIKHSLGINPILFSEVVKNSKTSMPDADQEKLFEYSTEKSYLSLNLKELFDNELEKEKLTEIFEMEVALTEVLANMEDIGIKINTDYLNELKKEFDNRRDNLVIEIDKLVGKPFNINSPKQLATVLFEDLALPVIKKTKTGYSTDEEVLKKLAKYSDIPLLILEYRGLTKLVSTYLDGLVAVADKNEIIRTTFNSTVTATGRLSSSNPNLQNIPIRTDNGKLIRKAFIARKGKKFIVVDYSQIELRILAHLSKDPTFIDSFNKGEDIHRRTASEVFNTPLVDVSDFQRSAAKSINFGLIYGMGEHKLSKELGIKHREAKKYIDLYFAKYAKIKEFKESVIENVREDGFIKTHFGRIRYFKDINSRNTNVRNHVERMAFNTLIQGTAADLIKFVMVKLDDYLNSLDFEAKMLLQIHDELIIEVDENFVEEVYPRIKDIMENSYKFNVPLIVDGSFSNNWEK